MAVFKDHSAFVRNWPAMSGF